MSPLEYHRPRSLKEAVALLGKARPLAGGTALTPDRRRLEAVIDLQDLELDRVARRDETLEIGSGVRLESLVDSDAVPEVLRQAARLEAGWNLRNAATVGGTVAAGDGRSPLLAVWLALRAEVLLEPGAEWADLDRVVSARPDSLQARLITSLRMPRPVGAAFEQVARTPADAPIVSVAAALWPGGKASVALGGCGPAPLRLVAEGAISDFAAAAGRAFAQAEDEWASASYRSQVASVLVRRTLEGLGLR